MIRHKFIWLLAGLVILTGASGCYPVALTPENEAGTPSATAYTALPSPAVEGTAEAATQPAPAATATRSFTAPTIPPAPTGTEEATVVTGAPIPTPLGPALEMLVTQAQEDLAGRLGIDSEQVELVDVQSVTWPDGGLGCPQPGMAYTQVQVDGLLIRLKAGGRVYEYHSGGARAPFLCDQAQ